MTYPKQFLVTIMLPAPTSRSNCEWLEEMSSKEELHDYIQAGIEKGQIWPELGNQVELESVVVR